MLTVLAMYGALGAIAGLLAGMLGVGGGIIIVPMLITAFTYQGIPQEFIMHLALGTSLASIIFTSLSSAFAHNKRQSVNWGIVKTIAPGIIVGTYVGSFFASKIPAQYLQIFFSIFLFYVATQMILGKSPKASRQMPAAFGMSVAGMSIGALSSLVGIGGGTVSVPFMLFHNIELRKAIGTSSAIGLPIAIAGALGYYVNGLSVENLPMYTKGFIYLPALAGIVLLSICTAPLGVRLAHTLPISQIKRCFAVLLLAVGIKMLFGAFSL